MTERVDPDKSPARILADVMVRGSIGSANVMTEFAKLSMGDLDLLECVHALQEKVTQVTRGDLSAAEGMLFEQASTLNTIFIELARRGAANLGTNLEVTDRYLRLALRAQSQSRATLETLATIKAGPAIFARQANIARTQQVNNGRVV